MTFLIFIDFTKILNYHKFYLIWIFGNPVKKAFNNYIIIDMYIKTMNKVIDINSKRTGYSKIKYKDGWEKTKSFFMSTVW